MDWTKKGALFPLQMGLLLVTAVLLAFSEHNAYVSLIVTRVCISALMAVGLYVCMVMAGQLSLGQGAYMAIGAYATALLLPREPGFMQLVVCAGLSVLLSGAFAFAAGYAVLGLTGDYLAVATLAFAETVRIVIINLEPLGNANGIYGIARFTTSGVSAFVLAAIAAAVILLKKTRFAGLLRAVRDDETAALSIGIDTRMTKVWAFAFSAGISGLAGFLFAGTGGFVTPFDFSFLRSMDTVAAVVLSGMGGVPSCILSAALIELSTALFQEAARLRMVLYGFGLIAVVIWREKRKKTA